VHLFDEFRAGQKTERAPERVVDVGPEALEVSSEATIDGDAAAALPEHGFPALEGIGIEPHNVRRRGEGRGRWRRGSSGRREAQAQAGVEKSSADGCIRRTTERRRRIYI
jgi:hypothetical protein